jgi:FkbM family methyltransferase
LYSISLLSTRISFRHPEKLKALTPTGPRFALGGSASYNDELFRRRLRVCLGVDMPSETRMGRPPRKIIVGIVLALIIAVLAFDALMMVRILVLLRGSECSFADSLRALRVLPVHWNIIGAQVARERSEAGLDLWTTPQGSIWTVQGEQNLPFLIYEQQIDIYEPRGHEVRSGDVVLDCGANIGMFTRTALTRGARLVIAIEPAPRTLDALRRNLEAEIRTGRVIVYPKGVWDREAQMDLSLNEANQGGNSVVLPGGTSPKATVPLTTIDNIVAQLQLPRVDFIKMDIEGSEKAAITGGTNTLRRFRPRLSISAEHLPDDFTAIPSLINSIEPRYSHRGCDCVRQPDRVQAMVIAFDPT